MSVIGNIVQRRFMSSSTIFNLSSGYGKCGVSIIRVSGPQTKHALQSIVRNKSEPRARYAVLRSFYYPNTKEMIDRGLVLWFPKPASFTGEDCCEFHVHGSSAVVSAMLKALGELPDLRLSKPGEFTKSAFFNGKLDLTEVDGLADLIHAETEAQRKQALLQSTGALSRIYDDWRNRLIRCAAHLEAYIDFAEDENIEDNILSNTIEEIKMLKKEIRAHLNDQRQGELLRDGIRTAIIGAPNVGKSSFLNIICQRQISIVTPLAGTTRDIIESTYNIGGYPVVFSDTAGLRTHTNDIVEKEGIDRARQCIDRADLILLIVDAKTLVERGVFEQKKLNTFLRLYESELSIAPNTLQNIAYKIIANKIDLITNEQLQQLQKLDTISLISCKTEQNLKSFLNDFQKTVVDICGQPTTENPRITQTRYRQQLECSLDLLNVYLRDFSPANETDMAISAQKIRQAIKCIETITGSVSTDNILDVVFRDFCIGK